MNVPETLLVCPATGIWPHQGRWYFDRKFHDGMLAYAAAWPGRVRLVLRRAESPLPQFGLVELETSRFPAAVTILEPEASVDAALLEGVDVVLASADEHRNLHLSALCRKHGIRCLYDIEYTLRTRLQIALLERRGGWQTFKSAAWLLLKERARRRAFRLAHGVQANGAPAFSAFAGLAPRALQYFDSRHTAAMVIDDAALEARLAYLDSGRPLRLGFSGRLTAIKGVDHLLLLAQALEQRGLAFSLDLFGAGDLAARIEEQIPHLRSAVRLHGPVDFAGELMPFFQRQIDLFVCCHRQGDPSCTYLETHACGVPILGYANEAHRGMLEHSRAGWAVPMSSLESLVERTLWLDTRRDQLKEKARNAARFARRHCFETTFARRVSQLR